ncbi:MAG: ABC transporter ATP-binding protein, partial [Clostridiales bacterium]|nr:ABC transporter ATP-binding protein [Clostridiales bacterium]
MFRLIRFIKGRTAAAIAAPLCKLLEAIAELAVPIIVANVIDVGIASGDSGYVVKYCIIIAALAAFGFAISVTGQFLASKVALYFGTRLRAETFKHINALPNAAHDRIG